MVDHLVHLLVEKTVHIMVGKMVAYLVDHRVAERVVVTADLKAAWLDFEMVVMMVVSLVSLPAG